MMEINSVPHLAIDDDAFSRLLYRFTCFNDDKFRFFDSVEIDISSFCKYCESCDILFSKERHRVQEYFSLTNYTKIQRQM